MISVPSPIVQDSKGNHYKHSYTGIRRWDPTTNSPIPRIRTSKKLRLKLKRLLCSAASSNSTSATAPSTSPA
jgi:hypothetical protein